MRKKLTPRLIDSLPLPIASRYEVRDELVIGLLIRVSASGGKVWYTTCRIKGKARRIRIGTYPILSLADAREKARELLRDVQLGKFDEDQRPLRPLAKSYRNSSNSMRSPETEAGRAQNAY
jgi:hypothetical protein